MNLKLNLNHMKIITLSIAAIILAFFTTAGVLYHNGSPGKKTGSPGDGANCTQCHTGTPVTGTAWISTTIPEDGYKPDSVYTITVSGSHSGAQRYGFEITSENATNQKAGAFITTDPARTKLLNPDGTAITHINNGISPVNDSISWTFDWQAPATGSGSITFYAAINAANGNSNTTGDVIYLSQDAVEEKIIQGSAELVNSKSLKVFPIPAVESLTIESSDRKLNNIQLYNSSGRMVYAQDIQDESSTTIGLEGFSAGIYFLQMDLGGQKETRRVVVK
jgi:hypothetical protein